MISSTLRVGLLSDTHGLLRAEARSFLIGSDYIIHGGDVGSADILEDLSSIAPLIAVRGNNDQAPWGAQLPQHELVRIGELFVYVLHDLAELDIEPRAADVAVVISGHSHKPAIAKRDGVLYVNPGSCGPRRFQLPISVGELRVRGREVQARTVELNGAK